MNRWECSRNQHRNIDEDMALFRRRAAKWNNLLALETTGCFAGNF